MSFFPHDFIFHQSNNEDQGHQGGMMVMRRSMSFSEVNHHHVFDEEEEERLLNQEHELSDDCGGGSSLGGEKKKRLKREQVRELERSFELGNKLDSERKQQLAKSLGLQPRQIAIWFQNRRARWRTKQLEKAYNQLKKQFASAMDDNDNLQSQNKQLRHELRALRGKYSILDVTTDIKKERAGYLGSSWSINASENSCEISLLDSTRTLTSMNLFPSFNRPATAPHFLETSLRSDPQPSRVDQHIPEDDSLFNILCGMDDQTTGVWSWAEQQHHFSQ